MPPKSTDLRASLKETAVEATSRLGAICSPSITSLLGMKKHGGFLDACTITVATEQAGRKTRFILRII